MLHGDMAELVDALDLKSSGATRLGSNPSIPTIFCKLCKKETKHLDFRPLPVQFKCMECGEYNREDSKHGES